MLNKAMFKEADIETYRIRIKSLKRRIFALVRMIEKYETRIKDIGEKQ